MKKVIPILIIILISIGCNSNSDFNSEEWNQKGVDWWMTDVREKMIEDLIQSDTLINLKKKEVIELLGQPIRNDISELSYLIREKYKSDIDPIYIKTLKIKFNNNGKVKAAKIEKN